MVEQRWREKRDKDGRVIPTCWVSESGYTVAECRLPAKSLVVTRPGGQKPFAYCADREEVGRVIDADIAASAMVEA